MNNHTRLPQYLKTKIATLDNNEYKEVRKILQKNSLNTVCDGARCPNKCECYSSKTATFLILGKTCTRNCAFCNISQRTPDEIDLDEPKHVANAVLELGLKYCVITSVTRDDLTDNHDFGSIHYKNTIEAVRKLNPDIKIEILTPDFKGDKIALDRVLTHSIDVFNHNVETIKRLYPKARQMADFECSLDVLKYAKSKNIITKTGFMLGLGETLDEIFELILKLDSIKTDIVTVGQYIQPSKSHLAVEKYYTLDEYKKIEEFILRHTKIYPLAAPLARSSYKANEACEAILRR